MKFVFSWILNTLQAFPSNRYFTISRNSSLSRFIFFEMVAQRMLPYTASQSQLVLKAMSSPQRISKLILVDDSFQPLTCSLGGLLTMILSSLSCVLLMLLKSWRQFTKFLSSRCMFLCSCSSGWSSRTPSARLTKRMASLMSSTPASRRRQIQQASRRALRMRPSWQCTQTRVSLACVKRWMELMARTSWQKGTLEYIDKQRCCTSPCSAISCSSLSTSAQQRYSLTFQIWNSRLPMCALRRAMVSGSGKATWQIWGRISVISQLRSTWSLSLWQLSAMLSLSVCTVLLSFSLLSIPTSDPNIRLYQR